MTMVVYIFNSKCLVKYSDGIVLHECDFHPCKSFFFDHPYIRPESIDKIYIKGILEVHEYPRAVIKCCDWMLKSGGELEIVYFSSQWSTVKLTKLSHIQSEISLVFGERISLLSKTINSSVNCVYRKIKPCLPDDDSISKWSFGIISNGRKNDRILQTINVIKSFDIPFFEILICGPSPSDKLPNFVRVLDDSHLYSDIRIPISKKKNLIAETARYNNLVIMHDRITLPNEWYLNMQKYGNNFDYLACRILDEETLSGRVSDWNWYESEIGKVRFNFMLPYDKWNNKLYINGGFMLIKNHLFNSVKLNNNLYWDEEEDVDFAIRCYNAGVLITLDKNNYLLSQSDRLGVYKERKGLRIFFRYFALAVSLIWRLLKENWQFNKFLASK